MSLTFWSQDSVCLEGASILRWGCSFQFFKKRIHILFFVAWTTTLARTYLGHRFGMRRSILRTIKKCSLLRSSWILALSITSKVLKVSCRIVQQLKRKWTEYYQGTVFKKTFLAIGEGTGSGLGWLSPLPLLFIRTRRIRMLEGKTSIQNHLSLSI